MRNYYTVLFWMLLLVGSGGSAWAGVPRMVSYQGRLVGGDGDVSLTFTFYDAETGGNVLWSETHSGVSRSNGLFTVQIGSQTTGGIPDEALDYTRLDLAATGVWLSASVLEGQNWIELSPRTQFLMVPYAAKAEVAEGLVRPGSLERALTVETSGALTLFDDYLPSAFKIISPIRNDQSGVINLRLSEPSTGNHRLFRFERRDATDTGDYAWTLRFDTGPEPSLRLYNEYRPDQGAVNWGPNHAFAWSGNVGFGTAAPAANLHVSSASPGAWSRILASNSDATKWVELWSGADPDNHPAILWPSGYSLRFHSGEADGSPSTEQMRITSDGKVGIRQTNPGEALEVNGNIKTTNNRSLPHISLDSAGSGDNWTDQGAYISIGENGALGSASMHITYTGDGYGYTGAGTVTNGVPAGGYWRYDYNQQLIDTPGSISIGTTASASKLHVRARGDGASLLYLDTDRAWEFRQSGSDGDAALELHSTVSSKSFKITGSSGGSVASFYTNQDPWRQKVYLVPEGGNTYVGASSHSADLRVYGRTVTNVIEITGADVAEKFPVSEPVKPGMVVAIDPEHPGHLCLAREAYDGRVAGIVSGANDLPAGAVLGNLPGAEDAPPIAMSGRVWCLCDADAGGSIKPGDLLTSSAKPGHAMRATDRSRAFGAILGKAMTELDSGQGLVLVLVTLH